MKTVSLSLAERVNVVAVLNDFKGGLDKLAVILEDVKAIAVTAEEWKEAGQVIKDLGDGQQQVTWQDDKVADKEINLQPATVDYIREVIKKKDESGEFGVTDKAFITLKEKLA